MTDFLGNVGDSRQMLMKTSQWLQERAPDTLTKGLFWLGGEHPISLSDAMYSSVGFRKSTHSQDHQLNILIGDSQQLVGDFLWDLTDSNELKSSFCDMNPTRLAQHSEFRVQCEPHACACRGTSLIGKRTLLGPYFSLCLGSLGVPRWVGAF